MASAAHRDRLLAAFAQFSDEELHAAINDLGDGEHLTNLAQVLNVKKPALRAHPDPASLLRGRVRSGGPGRAVIAALEVAGPCADACIDDLGDERSEDPTLEAMREVLPPLIEEFGAKIVTLMLAGYVAMEAPCGAVFDELLDTDERFAISVDSIAIDTAAADTATPEASVSQAALDSDAVAAKRARRKEADALKKEATRKQRDARDAAAAALRAARKHKRP
jgi:hypothetical protein